MQTLSNHLLDDLTAQTHRLAEAVSAWRALPLEQLTRRPAPNSWNALECLEHVCRYGDFYLPEIDQAIRRSRFAPEETFHSGLAGNYFAEMMRPQERTRKMKTFRSMNPLHSELDATTINRFVDQQQQFVSLLDAAREVSLNRTKTAISITSWIRLRLGDTFRVVIYHNDRHVQQGTRALALSVGVGRGAA